MKARALTADEVSRIRTYLEDAGTRDRALFELGVNAGLRVSEIVGLDVGLILSYGEVVEVLELYRTKGGRHRRVPLNRYVRGILEEFVAWKRGVGERLDPDAPLFCNGNGHRLSRQGADLILKRIYRACRLSGKLTTHSLRRTFATELLNRGASLRAIQVLLGHSSLATTERYLSVTDEQLSAAVAMLDG